jgi:hypothetical protein
VVEAQAEQPRDGLRAEHVDRLEPRVARREPDRPRRREQPRRRHELRVELAHGDDPHRVGRRLVRLAERDDRVVQLAARQRVVRPEGRDVRPHHAGRDDRRDLRGGPARRGGLERLGRQRHVGLGGRGECQRGEPDDDDPGEPRPHP